MQGEDGDHGTSVFHNSPLVRLIFTGGLAWGATPELFGPRNWGHWELELAVPQIVRKGPAMNKTVAARRIFCFLSMG